MKKVISLLLIISLFIVGCSNEKLSVSVIDAPKYKDGESFPIVLSITDGSNAVTDAEVIATLEMARMDHGTIEVIFTNEGDGTYVGDVELPMAGEWIANIVTTVNNKKSESTVTIDVVEG